MKILLEKYPKGTYAGQKTDGKYIDGYWYSNLKILAKKIVDDMTFMGIIFSSTLEVGTGKSVFATQTGEAWTEIMKEMHGIDVPFTTKNIVWRPKELIERAFQVPKYSFILLDEWEDQTYWSELGMTLRKFFRKCRQLNLFIMCIIPDWFQMNRGYAISRSAFAIDVKFGEGFTRGNFSFYGFEAKRSLYVKGKKEYNYHVAQPDFSGKFVDGYGVPEVEYRKAKRLDLLKYEEEEPKKVDEMEIKLRVIKSIYEGSKGKITQKQLADAVGVTQQAVSNWINNKRGAISPTVSFTTPDDNESMMNPNKEKNLDWSGGEAEGATQEEQHNTIGDDVVTN